MLLRDDPNPPRHSHSHTQWPQLPFKSSTLSSLAVRLFSIALYAYLTQVRFPGGTAACLVASRLADAEPSLKILVVEAGPHIQDDLAHLQPARFLSHLVPDSKVTTYVVGNPEPQLNGIQKIVPTGHCVGGGSSINCTFGSVTCRDVSLITSYSHDVYPCCCVGLRRLGEGVRQQGMGFERPYTLPEEGVYCSDKDGCQY